MSTSLTIYFNTSSQDLPRGSSGVDYLTFDEDNDELIFSNGSTVVADGEPIPSETALNQAGIIISDADQVVPKYFIADNDVNLLKEIHNMGNQNKRYVVCFSFDNTVASEPVLEVWDDDTVDTTDSYSLGAGTPADTWWRGVLTTDSLPGEDWVGTTLAGDTPGHFLWLNNQAGAFIGAKDLYINLKIIVPASFAYSGVESPCLIVKFCSN